MLQLHPLLASIRNRLGSFSGRGPAFWALTLLIAVLLPSPIAAPVLVARLRRGPSDAPPGPAPSQRHPSDAP